MSIQSLPMPQLLSDIGFALDLEAQAEVDGDQALAADAALAFMRLDDELARRIELSTPTT